MAVDRLWSGLTPVPIPTAPPWFLGLAPMGDQVVIAADLERVLADDTSAAPVEPSPDSLWLVTRIADHLLAFPITKVLGLCHARDVSPAPSARDHAARDRRFLGHFTAFGHDVAQVDLEFLAAALRRRAEAA